MTSTKTTKPSKFYTKHLAAIQSGTYSEGHIRGMKRALNAEIRTNRNLPTSSTSPKVTSDELWKLVNLISEQSPVIEAQQTRKGIAWLRNLWQTPKGTERKGNPFAAREQAVLAHFTHFTLIDFVDRGHHGLGFWLPVYRVHAPGKHFDYVPYSWQSSNDPIEIVG